MARFKFALEKVLQHRKMLEDLAARDYQLGLAELHKQQKILDVMKEQRHQAFENRFQQQVQGHAKSSGLTQVHEYLQGQDLRIKKQEEKMTEVEKQVETLRNILRDKSIETKIVEKLKERKQDEFRTEQKKIEQKKADDTNTSRFRSKDATDEKNRL